MNRYKTEVQSKTEDLGDDIRDDADICDDTGISRTDLGRMPSAAAEIIDKYIRSRGEQETSGEDIRQRTEQRYRRISEELLDIFYSCSAFIRIVPLQDLMGLDNSARMNTPGTVEGNWSWQAKEPIGWKKYGESSK